jgi:hypothetical protein
MTRSVGLAAAPGDWALVPESAEIARIGSDEQNVRSAGKCLQIRQPPLLGQLAATQLIALHTREDGGSKPPAPIIETDD